MYRGLIPNYKSFVYLLMIYLKHYGCFIHRTRLQLVRCFRHHHDFHDYERFDSQLFALSTTSLQSIPDRDAKEITGTFHPDIELVLNEVEAKMLPTKFGHKTFRAGQRDVIGRVLSGNCCLAVLPTGAGKSLLYMLPSQLLDGLFR